jgi:hypothetical protein
VRMELRSDVSETVSVSCDELLTSEYICLCPQAASVNPDDGGKDSLRNVGL